METCDFCQGPVDQATGFCRWCGRTPLEYPLASLSFPPAHGAAQSPCPHCGAVPTLGERVCHTCGLILTTFPTRQDDQLGAPIAGTTGSVAEAQPGNAHTFQVAPGPAGIPRESSTVPAGKKIFKGNSSRFRRGCVWVSALLLVAVGVSSLTIYLIQEQTRVSVPGTTGVSTPEPSATNTLVPRSTPTPLPPVGTGYWHTDGTQIVDAANRPIRIAGINWFGFESSTFVVHGLGQRDYHELLKQVKGLGYNTIRLPFSDQLFWADSIPNGISFANGMNQDLQRLSGLEIMDKLIAYSGQLGLKIILDHHGVDAGSQTDLWSAPDCSVSCFEADWQHVATHYLGNPTVIGADLDNEPHASACWGCADPSVDWQMEAQKLGNELLAINPHWLIFVEGVECYHGDCYWWGGNLEGVADTPVHLKVPNQVVYAPHDYPHEVSNLPYLSAPDYPQNLSGIWDAHWGFIARQHLAPLMLGEFGTLLADTADQQWLRALVTYLGTGVTGISWMYWALNPDSQDTGGILQNDWVTVNQQKQAYLNPLEFPLPGGSEGELNVP